MKEDHSFVTWINKRIVLISTRATCITNENETDMLLPSLRRDKKSKVAFIRP